MFILPVCQLDLEQYFERCHFGSVVKAPWTAYRGYSPQQLVIFQPLSSTVYLPPTKPPVSPLLFSLIQAKKAQKHLNKTWSDLALHFFSTEQRTVIKLVPLNVERKYSIFSWFAVNLTHLCKKSCTTNVFVQCCELNLIQLRVDWSTALSV